MSGGDGGARFGSTGNDRILEGLLQVLSTEHFVLQGARSAASSESNSRSGLYLTVLSWSTVALSFLSQAGKERRLVLFALLVLPVVFLLGTVTYVRVLQNGIEDFLYVRGLNRIRFAYTQLVPESTRYFVLSTHDDSLGVQTSMGLQPSPWQALVTSANTVSTVNSIVGGVTVAVFLRGPLHVREPWSIALGTVVTAAIGIAFLAHQRAKWGHALGSLPVLSPSAETADARSDTSD